MLTQLLRRPSCPWNHGFVRFTSSGHPECREQPKSPYYDPHHDDSIRGRRPRCYIGRKSLVTMAGGVGVGPELMAVVKRVFECANAPVMFEELPMGADADKQEMDNLIYSVERNGVAIKGNIEKALEPREMSRNMAMRRALDLFVNLIEIKSYPGLIEKTRFKREVDVVLVRQNTEGEFAMLEHHNGKGVEHLKITTVYNTNRLAEFAFQYAQKHNRNKVSVVFNKDGQSWCEGLFVDVVGQVAARYPDIPFAMQSMHSFASRMTKFDFNGDVIITQVVHGGILMSMLLGFLNGTGLYCGQNLGSRYAVFEPAARNKGYKLEGKDLVNPVSALVCGVELLRYLNHNTTADRIERAINLTINDDKIHTQDILGTASTSEMVLNIERRIREKMPEGYRDEVPPPLPQTPPYLQPFH